VRIVVKVREGPRVSRARFESVEEALVHVRDSAQAISGRASGRTVNAVLRSFDPVEQVVGRVEVLVSEGRFRTSLRAGVDVRGDGSIEAFRGGVQRVVVEPGPGEGVFDALRHTLDP
jgi:hypothetical protein